MKNKIFIGVLMLVAVIRWMEVEADGKSQFMPGDEVINMEIVFETDLVPDWRGKFRLWYQGIWIEGNLDTVWPEGSRALITGNVKERVINNTTSKMYLDVAKLKVYKSESGLEFWIREMSRGIREKIRMWLPPESADLVMGIVWGDQEGLSAKTRQMYRNSGLSHLLVASGFNVTLVAGGMTIITERYLRKKYAVLTSIVCTILYGFVLGMQIPVIRAVLLFGIMQFGVILGRRSTGLYTLLLLASVFIIINPLIVRSLSFILSFLATAGLVISPKSKNIVLGLLYQNISVMIMIAPVLVAGFGSIQLAGIPANLLVEPFIPLVSAFGMVSAIAGTVFPVTGKILIYLVWPYLVWVSEVARFFSELNINLSGMIDLPLVLILPYYLGIYLLYMRRKMSLF